MLLRKIEALRKKPKHVRNRHAFWWAFFATAVIATFWMVSLPAKFAEVSNLKGADDEREGNFSRVMSDVQSNVANTFQAIREQSAGQEEAVDTKAEDTGEGNGSSSTTLDQLDFSFVFASSTNDQEEKREQFLQERRVLIGTTSAKRATTSVE